MMRDNFLRLIFLENASKTNCYLQTFPSKRWSLNLQKVFSPPFELLAVEFSPEIQLFDFSPFLTESSTTLFLPSPT